MTVKFTLEFPTIDEAIAALTKLSADPGTVAANAVSEINTRTPVIEAPKTEAPKPKAEKTASPPAAAASSQPETVAAPPASSPEASASVPAAESVDYPTLQKAVFALAGKSREAAAAVAASLGVKTFKELDASKWGEALAAVNAKIAELG